MNIRRVRVPVLLMSGAALMFALQTKVEAQALQVSPTQLSFSSQTGGSAPPSQSVTILAAGQTAENFAVQITGSGAGTSAPAWLTVSESAGTTPSALVVSVNPTGLTSTSSPYTASLQISVPSGGQNPIVIPVTLTVSNGTAQLVTTPTFLRFATRVQEPGTFTQTLVLNEGGGGALLYQASIVAQNPPAFWISGITPSFGEIGPFSPVFLQVTVNTQGLAVGSYHQIIQITSPAGSINVPVSLFVANQGSILGLNVTGLHFPVAQGSSTSPPQTVTVQNLGDPGTTVSWTADMPYGSSWLTLGGATGIATPANPGTLSLTPNSAAASLPAGASYALVRVSDPNSLNSPQYVVAMLDVEPASSPLLSGILPSGLTFTTASGAPSAQVISVYTSSSTPSAFEVSATTADGVSWLAANATTSTASAQALGQVSVSVNAATLAPGVYTGGVNIAIGGVLRTENVTLIVAPATCTPSSLALTPTSVPNNFVLAAGYPAPLMIQLQDNCGNLIANGSAVASFSNGDAALPLVAGSQAGTYSATWQPGTATSSMTITITASAPCCGTATTQLIGAVNANAVAPPTLVPNGALNIFFNVADADLYGGALAVGDVAQVYGTGLASAASGTSVPLPPQMNGTFMLVGNLNATFFYLSSTLLNVLIPFELTANQEYQAVVGSNGAFTLPETIDVVPFQPGIAAFSDGSIIAQHSDYSLVTASSPGKPGENLVIYLAGMGATNPSVPSGDLTPSQLVPVTVQPTLTIDGQSANIGYAGLTPTGVGLYQINFTVPTNSRLGNVSLIVNQDGVTDATTLPVAGTASSQQLALTPNPLSLTTANGTLTVTVPAPVGTTAQIVNLTSSNTSIATVPATVVISPGTSSASVTVTPGNTSGAATITSSAPGFLSGSTTVNVTATGAASIAATSGTGQKTAITTAFANPLVVTVKDASGNPISGVMVAFTAPSTGASGAFAAGVNTATTNAQGVATSATFIANGTVGTYAVTAIVTGLSSTATFVLTNTVGAPASIAATSGSGQSTTINTAFASPLAATVTDSNGNLLSGIAVTFTVPSSGASAAFAGGVTTATTNSSGVAQSVAIAANATAGAYTVTAYVAGVSTPATFTLTNTAGSPASITASGGGGQSAATNAAFSSPLSATVKDSGGNPLSGVTVTFTVPSTGASATFAGGVSTATTNSSGVATSGSLTANATTGSYTVIASVAGLSTTASFSLTNTASGQASIAAVSGSGQSATVSTAFANPLVVMVQNASGAAMSGATVTFTVPSSGAGAAFAGGVNTATTNAAGMATSAALTANGTAGTYSVTASVAGISTPATFTLTNLPGATAGALTVNLTSTTVGQNLETAGTVIVLQAAPASGISVTLTSSAPTKALLATSATGSGSASISVVIAQGTYSIPFYVFGVASSGTATITASTTAAGLANGTATVTLATSGFVISGPGGLTTPNITTSPGSTASVTVSAAQLDTSGNYVQSQPLAGGAMVPVTVTSSTPAVGTISGSPVTFGPGVATGTLTFNAAAAGSTTLAVMTPTGFTTPSEDTSLTATVASSELTTTPVTVGKNLEAIATVGPTTPPTSAISITITSNNPSQLLLSTSSTGAGSASIVVTVPANATSGAEFYVYGLASSGSPTYTASAAGMGSATGTVTLAPSGIVITPYPSFITNIDQTGQAAQTVTVFSALLDASGNFSAQLNVAGGLSATVNISSSSSSVGTVSPATLTIAGGSDSATTQFNPAGPGTTTLTASTPTGFTTPAPANSTQPGPAVTATVKNAGIALQENFGNGILGNNLEDMGTATIATPAPAGGLVITLTSNDSHLLLSTTGQDKGLPSISVTIPAGSQTANYYIYALASSGSGSYTATSPGYTSKTDTITYYPSAVQALGEFAFGGQQYLNASVSAGPTTIPLITAVVDSGGNFLVQLPLSGAASAVTVSLTSSSPSIGTVVPSVTIPPGSGIFALVPSPGSVSATFTPVAVGKTTITLSTPSGYSTPVANTVMTTVSS
jgi:hypothetical protein